jgi:hypothetical protein
MAEVSVGSYQGRQGVWVVFSYETESGAVARSIHDNSVRAIEVSETWDHIAFWPFNMELSEAISWWNSVRAEE